MSKPRTLSPVVSRFKGWFIDITDKAKPGKLDGVGVVEGICWPANHGTRQRGSLSKPKKATSSGPLLENTKAGTSWLTIAQKRAPKARRSP